MDIFTSFLQICCQKIIPKSHDIRQCNHISCCLGGIRSVCNDDGVHAYLSHRNIEWQFIPQRAPWFGGFYEWLIGTTKTSLKKTLGKRLVTFDELWTLVTEIETVVNERPITYQHCSLNEPTPLTPSMLVNDCSLLMMPHPVVTDE